MRARARTSRGLRPARRGRRLTRVAQPPALGYDCPVLSGAPFCLSLVLTHACNLACSYCYMGEHHRSAMSRDVAFRALELAFEQPNDVDVSFFGGEPLLEYDLLVACAARARELARDTGRDVRLQVTTNGTLLGHERLATMLALDVRVTLSLDGIREAHERGRPKAGGGSSFDAVVEAAKLLASSAHGLDVIAVVTPENVRHLAASVSFIADLGARRIFLNPSWERRFGDDDLVAWEAQLEAVADLWSQARGDGRDLAITTFDRKILAAARGGLAAAEHCSVGSRNIAVAPSGNLYPCDRLVADDRDGRFVIGTLDRGLPGPVHALERGPADAECEPCPERFRCGASCACANLAETDTTHLPGATQCWYEQTTARIADEAALRLVSRASEPFAAWLYGRHLEARRMLPVLR